MTLGKLKSRTYRRVQRKTPGAKTATHYVKSSPSPSKCTSCGAVLPGVARGRKAEMQNMPKTKKRPERPFGGVLCTKCSRKKIKLEAR